MKKFKTLVLATLAIVVLAGCSDAVKETTNNNKEKSQNLKTEATNKAMQGEEENEMMGEHPADMSKQHVLVEDQAVKNGTVTIEGVNAFEDGWIVIHNVKNGKFAEVIGQAPVKKGGVTNVVVKIDTTKATKELNAMLHMDKGTIGTYEFPGADAPVKEDGAIVMTNFMTGADVVKENMLNVKEFNITGKNFAFSQKEVRVKKGDTVKINFEASEGFHDWAVDEFKAKTKQVAPGTKTSVEFIADKKGIFEFYCSVGNHRAQGMVGKLVVE